MKYLLLTGLLLALAGCGPRTTQGPNGCQVLGPYLTSTGTGTGMLATYKITYRVSGFQPGDTAIHKFIERIAHSSLSQESEEGAYDIGFTDQRTGVGVYGIQAQVTADELDRRRKISYR